MLKDNLSDYIFIDIETVPQYKTYKDAPEHAQHLWEKKSSYQRKNEETAEEFYQKAGIWAEFGKIVCISCGYIDADSRKLRIKSFYNSNEKLLIEEFSDVLVKFCNSRNQPKLCAHNGKEFDFPYIARRTLINEIPLPTVLNVQNMKPWEVPFVDTLELWKFGDHKHYCSLELLASVFGIPTPKDDIDGSMVSTVYYEENNIKRIVTYCEKDVQTLASLFLKINQESPISDIIIVE